MAFENVGTQSSQDAASQECPGFTGAEAPRNAHGQWEAPESSTLWHYFGGEKYLKNHHLINKTSKR